MSAVPIIYSRTDAVLPMRLPGRVLAGLIALACLATLVQAVRLAPNSAGVGTHRAMGLQQCGFLERTGLPCPTCGMTTSFAQFVRGRWLASFYIQPMGFVLAVLTGIAFWIAAYEAVSGKPVHRLLGLLPMHYHLLPLMAGIVIAWAWKIFIHVRGIDGWG